MRVRIFTDGSCSENPGPGGWAAIFCFENGHKDLTGYELETTNNRMELTAVLESYKMIEKSERYKEFEILSDSAYVLNAIKQNWLLNWTLNGWKNSKGEEIKNKDLWKELNRVRVVVARQGKDVILTKVKGHSGNTYNELADKKAVEMTEKAKRGQKNV